MCWRAVKQKSNQPKKNLTTQMSDTGPMVLWFFLWHMLIIFSALTVPLDLSTHVWSNCHRGGCFVYLTVAVTVTGSSLWNVYKLGVYKTYRILLLMNSVYLHDDDRDWWTIWNTQWTQPYSYILLAQSYAYISNKIVRYNCKKLYYV